MKAPTNSTILSGRKPAMAVRFAVSALLPILLGAAGCAHRTASSPATEVHPEWASRTPSTRIEWHYPSLPAPEPSKKPIYRLKELNFPKPSSTSLNREGQGVLHEVASWLAEHAAARVLVVGFADGTGERARGDALARERVRTARAELARRGVAGERIEEASFGSAMATAPADQPLAQQSDRKVEVWVLEE